MKFTDLSDVAAQFLTAVSIQLQKSAALQFLMSSPEINEKSGVG